MSEPSEQQSENADNGKPDEYDWYLGPVKLGRKDLQGLFDAFEAAGMTVELEAAAAPIASLAELNEQSSRSPVRMRGASSGLNATLTLAPYEAALSVRGNEDEAIALVKTCDELTAGGRSAWAWITHGDFSIVVGAAAVAGLVLAVGNRSTMVAAIGGGLWLIYMMWVRHNQEQRTCVLDL